MSAMIFVVGVVYREMSTSVELIYTHEKSIRMEEESLGLVGSLLFLIDIMKASKHKCCKN